MTLSMYEASIPVFQRALTNLSAILAKAAAHAEAKKFDPVVLVNARLAPDMLPLSRQIQIAVDHARGAAARLAGLERPPVADTEATLDELQARIASTLAYIGTFSAGIFNPSGFDPAAINSGTRLLRVYTGNVTDFVYPIVLSTLATLENLGIRYDFAGITPGPHGWDTWQKNLIDFAPRLFRTEVG